MKKPVKKAMPAAKKMEIKKKKISNAADKVMSRAFSY
jgi:hypothetical protein